MRQRFESSPIQPRRPAPEVISAASAECPGLDHDGQARTATACTNALFHILHKGAAVSASPITNRGGIRRAVLVVRHDLLSMAARVPNMAYTRPGEDGREYRSIRPCSQA